MKKINFTQEHFNTMQELAFDMLVNNKVITNSWGTPLNISELMHTQTINSLNNIKENLSKKIDKLEKQDEWVEVDQTKLNELKDQKELVNLIIGWKRFNIERSEIEAEREKILTQISDLKEAQKTPEEQIKSLEEKLSQLSN